MAGKRRKKPKNRYSRSAKYSEFKTLQLIECFALDFSVSRAAKAIRMSERTVRDRYAEIRAKLLPWCVEDVQRVWPSASGYGRKDQSARPGGAVSSLPVPGVQETNGGTLSEIPKRKGPVLHHVIEIALRRFTAVELPEVNAGFREAVTRIFSAAQSEAYIACLGKAALVNQGRRRYWEAAFRRMQGRKDFAVRRFPQAAGEQFYRDLRYMLRRDPL
jgi:hypothetical protein